MPAIFKMSNNITYNYRGSWCAEGLPTTWECDWRFIGSKGTLLWDGADEIKVELAKDTDQWIRDCESVAVEMTEWDENRNGHKGLISHVYKLWIIQSRIGK